MPLSKYQPEDPFDNHPLFKTEEQARLEETLDGVESPFEAEATAEPVSRRVARPRRPQSRHSPSSKRASGAARATSTGATSAGLAPQGRHACRLLSLRWGIRALLSRRDSVTATRGRDSCGRTFISAPASPPGHLACGSRSERSRRRLAGPVGSTRPAAARRPSPCAPRRARRVVPAPGRRLPRHPGRAGPRRAARADRGHARGADPARLAHDLLGRRAAAAAPAGALARPVGRRSCSATRCTSARGSRAGRPSTARRCSSTRPISTRA